ncbi:MAG: hypothetical protein JWP56_2995 [Aeromicrobium sp.]|nr:hypothetical protein [Aeromicrobium sp.]
MQLFKLSFEGYRKLERTECNVAGRTIALIGPNEVGKSTVLQALDWLSHGGALDQPLWNRATKPEEATFVARAFFKPDKEDFAALGALDLDLDSSQVLTDLREFRVSRQRAGSRITGTTPTFRRALEPFNAAVEQCGFIADLFGRISAADIEEEAETLARTIEVHASELKQLLAMDAGQTWLGDEDALERRTQLTDNLIIYLGDAAEVASMSDHLTGHRRILNKTESRLRSAIAMGRKEDPDIAVRSLLRQRSPEFVLFTDDDRIIKASYQLADETVRVEPGRPLANLLRIAGTSVEEIWDVVSSGVVSDRASLQKRVNAQLMQRVKPIWTQSNLTVELNIERDGFLEVGIFDLDHPSGRVTPIDERSDGLRAFLGLVCFLLAQEFDTPPVLLIDEAERNLHYDAQADLIRVLTNELDVAKVIYTTHSPGCLPLDLGSNIRVVERIDSDRSELLNNFWTDTESGFSRLLFAMGAGAAAYSEFRKALLTEGVSEMLLLPPMLRKATGKELDFQVAFGLSNMSARKTVGKIALITTYLLDGDKSGDTMVRQLRRAGVPSGHIAQLPSGSAIEDLISPSQYIEVVNRLLEAAGHAPIDLRSLDSTLTIAKAVDVLCESLGTPPPGHKIVAAELAALGSDVKLTADGRTFLRRLHTQLESAFETTYELRDLPEDESD